MQVLQHTLSLGIPLLASWCLALPSGCLDQSVARGSDHVWIHNRIYGQPTYHDLLVIAKLFGGLGSPLSAIDSR